MENNQTNEEHLFRINIKQNAKKEAYFDITVRGNSKDEVSNRLTEAIDVAGKKCKELNKDEEK